MFLFTSSDDAHDITLKCDPARESGGDLTVFTVKPLTKAIRNAATAAAGPINYAGKVINQRIYAAMAATRRAKLAEIRPDLAALGDYVSSKEDLTEDEKLTIGQAVLITEAAEHNKLTGVEEGHLLEATDWAERCNLECFAGVLAKLNGVDVADPKEMISLCRPLSLQEPIITEVVSVAIELAELDPKACARYVEQYGTASTSAE